jgi:hypothetical protein
MHLHSECTESHPTLSFLRTLQFLMKDALVNNDYEVRPWLNSQNHSSLDKRIPYPCCDNAQDAWLQDDCLESA